VSTAAKQGHDAPAAAAASGLDDSAAVVFAFVGSGCLLVLEIVAGRLLAPTLGVSLYTWTSVIGVVLAGVSLGNVAGGRIADRWPARSTLALLYLAASVASLAILALVPYVDSLQLPGGAPAILQVLWLNAILFLVPSTLLAAPTPVLTRLSLHRVEEGGRVVGRIQAAASAGSIVGTFLTGFLLISAFGTRRIVAGVAVALLLLAVASRPPWLRGRVFELGSLGAVILAAGWWSPSGCLKESDYYCIKVAKVNVGVASESGVPVASGDFRALYLDRLLHGVVDLSDPTVLFYEYEQLYAKAIASVIAPGSRLDSFFLGGGEYAFPRYMEARYRGNVDVVEIDPAVTSVARTHLGLRPSKRMRIHHEDARRYLESVPAGARYDLVFGDTFNDFQVPYQLTTREFNDLLARHLTDRGLYLLNVIDAAHNDFLRSEIRTLRETFPYVGLLQIPGTWPPGKDRTTYVIVAGKQRPGRPLPNAVPQRQIDAFLKSGHSVVLTDDHVPVDQLLAPVFSQALEG
jgi:MFS family permease